jgi:hypothetical protein
MRRLIAIITFGCFLFVSAAEGRVLIVCVNIGCSPELIKTPRLPQRAKGCCSSFDYGSAVYKCVPIPRSIVCLKKLIDYRQANSINTRCSSELSNPVFNAVLGDQHKLSTERPRGTVSETAAGYDEIFNYRPVFENLVFIHPQISITVLRL